MNNHPPQSSQFSQPSQLSQSSQIKKGAARRPRPPREYKINVWLVLYSTQSSEYKFSIMHPSISSFTNSNACLKAA